MSFTAAPRRFILPVLLAASTLAAAAPALAAQDYEPVLLGTAAGSPTAINFAPGVTNQCYVAEKGGRIWRFVNGNYATPPVLDIRNLVDNAGEGGLLGMVFDPGFETNRYFYLAYTRYSGAGAADSLIARYTMMPGSDDLADPASEEIIWGPIPQQSSGHKGGDIEFGPDGMLYHSLGDGDAGSQMMLPTAMDLTDPRGSVLRFDVRLPFPHVPADNPYAGSATENEHIWVSGFRNPFRMEVDSVSGDVYVADVGPGNYEEVTRIDPETQAGLFAGWPCREALACLNFAGCSCPAPGYVDPIAVLNHGSPHNACAIMGGVVVRGGVVASLESSYIFTDFCSGKFYRIDDPSGAATLVDISDVINRDGGQPIRFIVDFTVGPDGKVYFCGHYGAEIWVLEPRGGFDTYCSTEVNSSGNAASITASGSPSIGDGMLDLEVVDLPPLSSGIFLMSMGALEIPMFNGSQGTLCVGPTINRWGVGLASDATGRVFYQSNLQDLPQGVVVLPGDTWFFQYWTRDANPQATSNTSNGASVLFLP